MKVRDRPVNGGKLSKRGGVGEGKDGSCVPVCDVEDAGCVPLGEVGPELPHATENTSRTTTAPQRIEVLIDAGPP